MSCGRIYSWHKCFRLWTTERSELLLRKVVAQASTNATTPFLALALSLFVPDPLLSTRPLPNPREELPSIPFTQTPMAYTLLPSSKYREMSGGKISSLTGDVARSFPGNRTILGVSKNGVDAAFLRTPGRFVTARITADPARNCKWDDKVMGDAQAWWVLLSEQERERGRLAL